MSMNLSIYSGPAQEKPIVTAESHDGTHWVSICYGGSTLGSQISFFGRSRAQCERLAAAWLAMWDEPASAGLPDRVVRPDPQSDMLAAQRETQGREPDDTRYRADMIDAGRGHLLKG